MKYIFVPLGSAGDVNPITWLAQLMARRGHDVVVVAHAGMAQVPARAGLRGQLALREAVALPQDAHERPVAERHALRGEPRGEVAGQRARRLAHDVGKAVAQRRISLPWREDSSMARQACSVAIAHSPLCSGAWPCMTAP